MKKIDLVNREIIVIEKELNRLNELKKKVRGSNVADCSACGTRNLIWYVTEKWCCCYCGVNAKPKT